MAGLAGDTMGLILLLPAALKFRPAPALLGSVPLGSSRQVALHCELLLPSLF